MQLPASSTKKQAFCLFVSYTIYTDNSITSRHRRFRSTALSFLARWAKRKLSYLVQLSLSSINCIWSPVPALQLLLKQQ